MKISNNMTLWCSGGQCGLRAAGRWAARCWMLAMLDAGRLLLGRLRLLNVACRGKLCVGKLL